MADYKELFFGQVDAEGKLHLTHKERWTQALRRFAGKEVQVSVDKKVDGRSNNQNKYYWAVVVKPLAEFCGYADPEEFHEILKNKFNRKYAQSDKLGLVLYGGSTAKLSTSDFEDYLERIRTWAQTDLNFKIPLPGEIELPE